MSSMRVDDFTACNFGAKTVLDLLGPTVVPVHTWHLHNCCRRLDVGSWEVQLEWTTQIQSIPSALVL